MNSKIDKILRNRITIPFTPFYRKYKFNSPVSINSSDARGCVDFEMGIFCNRVPKAANSSVMTSLAAAKFNQDVPSKEAKKLFRSPSQLSRKEVDAFTELFKFAFIRNPFTRTLSAFLDKIERRALRVNKDLSYKEFLYSLEMGDLYKNAHWAPQTSILLIPVERFDFLGRIENFDADMTYVLDRIHGREGEARIRPMWDNATGANDKVRKYYDEECVDLVKKLFREDFDRLEYSDRLDF